MKRDKQSYKDKAELAALGVAVAALTGTPPEGGEVVGADEGGVAPPGEADAAALGVGAEVDGEGEEAGWLSEVEVVGLIEPFMGELVFSAALSAVSDTLTGLEVFELVGLLLVTFL